MTLTISKEQGAWQYGSREGPSEPFKAADNGCTPLLVASDQGHVDVARLLIEAGADIDEAKYDGATPLFIASQRGHVEVVKALLDGGADATQATNFGMTPLMIAKLMNHAEIVALLEAAA